MNKLIKSFLLVLSFVLTVYLLYLPLNFLRSGILFYFFTTPLIFSVINKKVFEVLFKKDNPRNSRTFFLITLVVSYLVLLSMYFYVVNNIAPLF